MNCDSRRLALYGGVNVEKFISKEILDVLSYQSQLKRSLKQISLSQTPLEEILEDI